MEDVKTVAVFREPYGAHLARGRLEAEGIPALVLDETLVNLNWTYSQAIGGVKVRVPAEAEERARRILSEPPDTGSEPEEDVPFKPDDEDICPTCGSANSVRRPYSLCSIVVSLYFLLPFFYRKKGRVCKDCGTVWKVKGG